MNLKRKNKKVIFLGIFSILLISLFTFITSQNAFASTEEGSSGVVSATNSGESSEDFSSETVPIQNFLAPDPTITLAGGDTLALNANGAYLIIPPGGTIPPTTAEWAAATNGYDANTQVILPNEGASESSFSIITEGSATISSIAGHKDSSSLTILSGSNLTVASLNDAIILKNLYIGDMNGTLTTPTIVNVTSSAGRGIVFIGELKLFEAANLTIQSAGDGIFYDEVYSLSGSSSSGMIGQYYNSSLNVTSSNAQGIYAISLNIIASNFTVNAKTGGVLFENEFYVDSDNNYPGSSSNIDVTTQTGYGVESLMGYFSAYNADLSFISQQGEGAGIYVSSLYAQGSPEAINSFVAKADIGYGIAGQSMNDAYPGGSLTLSYLDVDVHVNEGMAISAYFGMFDNLTLKATAEKGIAFSSCTLSIYNSTTEFISNGSTTNHFNVYGAIADSVGINILSMFDTRESTIKASAPIDDPNSYAIHGSLPIINSGVMGGSFMFQDTVLELSAGIGISSPNVITNNTDISIEASNYGMLILSGYFQTNSYINSVANNIDITMLNSGIGIALDYETYIEFQPNAVDSYPPMFSFSLDFTNLSIQGADIGIDMNADLLSSFSENPLYYSFDSRNYSSVDISAKNIGWNWNIITDSTTSDADYNFADTTVNIETTATPEENPNSVGFQLLQTGNGPKNNIFFSSTDSTIFNGIKASGNAYGILIDGTPLKLDGNVTLDGTGEEVGLAITNPGTDILTSPMSSEMIKFIGTSRTVPPDLAGRRPSVLLERSSSIVSSKIIENYEAQSTNSIPIEPPYYIYANGMNVADVEAYTWKTSANEALEAHPDGVTAPATLFGVKNIQALALGTQPTFPGNIHEINLKAKINQYTLSFDSNGGTPTPPDQEVFINDLITQPIGVTYTHYVLEGWYDKEDTEQTLWDFATDKMPSRNLTLVAKWTPQPYDVIFNANASGGEPTENIPSTLSIPHGSLITEPTPNPSRAGYTFKYWSSDTAGSSIWDFATQTMPTNDLTLYAIWELNAYTVTFDGNGGQPETQTISAKYTDLISPATTEPTKRAFAFTGWYKDQAATQKWDFAADTMPYEDLTLYAGWQRTHWEIFFDTNGGNFPLGEESMLVPIGQPIDIESIQPGAPNDPKYAGHGFIGWTDQNGQVMRSGLVPNQDYTLKANWISLSDIMKNNGDENIVIYKNEATPEDVDRMLDPVASYTDLLGVSHELNSYYEWNTSITNEGGVEEIQFYVIDPVSGEKIYSSTQLAYLYVLNRPFISGESYYWIFVGDSIDFIQQNVMGYGEYPNFVEKRIDRSVVPLTFNKDGINVWEVGTYYGSFTGTFSDYFGNNQDFVYPVTVRVMERKGLTKEEKLQVESSEFWVKVTDIYHQMSAGQVIEINENNFKDGGRLLDEKIPENAGYDRLIRVTPGQYVIMNPCILDRMKVDTMGQMDVYLEGRTLGFNSADFDQNINYNVTGYYDLRMNTSPVEAMSTIVGTEQAQMQLEFNMNRSWLGEVLFTIAPNDSIKDAVAKGSIPYLFHYNENTNELEIVGQMTVLSNGNLQISITGVYKDYVILAGLPSDGGYRITDKTNALTTSTYSAIAENQIDSGKNLPNGTGLNGISAVQYQQIDDIINESTVISNDSSNNLLVGIIAGIVLVGTGSGLFIYLKKRNDS